MGNLNRREFLEELIATQVSPKEGEDKIFKKYANHTLPHGLAKATGTLTPYGGAWTKAEVMHLLRRTTFGIRPADVNTLLGMSMSAAVDYLFSNAPASAPAPPVNNYYNSGYVDPTGVSNGATWVNALYGDGTVNSKRRFSFKSWWMGQIVNENLSILEKMTWFWHNHFSTESANVGDARIVYGHHAMLRANALGNFKTLVTLVTKDPAMLIYLNGQANVATAPDENYGRELQELFTVSKYNNPNYTEDDVKAAARVLTGWQVNYATTPVTAKFTSSRHDTGTKVFSPFYNNTIINGVSGAAGANETDTLINMIFSTAAPAVANWICTKLYRYFVYYDTVTDVTVQTNIINGMATALINNNWDVKPAIKLLLKSQHFFDLSNRSCYIKTPLDYYAGMFKTFGITLPTTFDAQKTYAVWNALRQYAADNGLDLADPPDVSGFPAYYQSPQYYELWINSNTFPKRLQFADMMVSSGFSAGTGTAIKIDVLAFANGCADVSDPDKLVIYCCEMLLGLDISATHKDNLKSILLSGQTSNYYWTQAWQTYIATPNTTNTNIVKTRLSSLLKEILHLPEHHLA